MIGGFFGLLKTTDDEKKAEIMKKINENLEKVVAYLAKDNKQFICGEEPGMTDYMMWPFLERISILTSDVLKAHPALQAYCERMEKDRAVVACRHSNEMLKQYMNGYLSGNAVYDVGNVTEY